LTERYISLVFSSSTTLSISNGVLIPPGIPLLIGSWTVLHPHALLRRFASVYVLVG
jgi:hypothetical protein